MSDLDFQKEEHFHDASGISKKRSSLIIRYFFTVAADVSLLSLSLSIPSAVTYLCSERLVHPQLLGTLLPYILELFVKKMIIFNIVVRAQLHKENQHSQEGANTDNFGGGRIYLHWKCSSQSSNTYPLF